MRQLKITNRITARESIALDKYLSDISKIDLLTAQEEAELAARIREGDKEALEKMTKANLRFVVSVAKQYQNQGLSLPDLINEGNVGLMKAAKRFDETKGFKFISYAVWWIRQSIIQAIVEYSRLVRLPAGKVTSYNRINETYRSFVQEFEREPSPEEIADILELPVRDVEALLKERNKYVSVDAPISGEDDAGTMLDLITDEEGDSPDLRLMEESLKKEVQYGLQSLSPRETDILNAYYGLNGEQPRTLDEIGEMYDLTRERVRQLKERALLRLRKSMNKNKLKSYLG